MVAACQVEPNVTPIPAATSRHIDSAVTGCRDGAFAQYADSPFRLGWAQAECDKAGEEARKGDWDRGLLPTPSTLSPEPTATATATPDPTPTPEPLATGYVWRVDWYLECPDSYESSRYGTQYPTGRGGLWLLDEWGKQTKYTGRSIDCGGKQSGQRIGSTYFVKRDTDCANSPRLYYPLWMLRTGAGTPVDIGCVNPAYVLGVGIHYENFYTASHHNPSARGDTTVTRESYTTSTSSWTDGKTGSGQWVLGCAGGGRYIQLIRWTWRPDLEPRPEYEIGEAVRDEDGIERSTEMSEQFDATPEQALERHAELCEREGLKLY